jgi:hypothetical protein
MSSFFISIFRRTLRHSKHLWRSRGKLRTLRAIFRKVTKFINQGVKKATFCGVIPCSLVQIYLHASLAVCKVHTSILSEAIVRSTET